jgi:hypothetical protein
MKLTGLFMVAAFFLAYVTCNFALSKHSSRAVGPSSKAGLGWPMNVPWVDITQYQATGKVSWSVVSILTPTHQAEPSI